MSTATLYFATENARALEAISNDVAAVVNTTKVKKILAFVKEAEYGGTSRWLDASLIERRDPTFEVYTIDRYDEIMMTHDRNTQTLIILSPEKNRPVSIDQNELCTIAWKPRAWSFYVNLTERPSYQKALQRCRGVTIRDVRPPELEHRTAVEERVTDWTNQQEEEKSPVANLNLYTGDNFVLNLGKVMAAVTQAFRNSDPEATEIHLFANSGVVEMVKHTLEDNVDYEDIRGEIRFHDNDHFYDVLNSLDPAKHAIVHYVAQSQESIEELEASILLEMATKYPQCTFFLDLGEDPTVPAKLAADMGAYHQHIACPCCTEETRQETRMGKVYLHLTSETIMSDVVARSNHPMARAEKVAVFCPQQSLDMTHAYLRPTLEKAGRDYYIGTLDNRELERYLNATSGNQPVAIIVYPSSATSIESLTNILEENPEWNIHVDVSNRSEEEIEKLTKDARFGVVHGHQPVWGNRFPTGWVAPGEGMQGGIPQERQRNFNPQANPPASQHNWGWGMLEDNTSHVEEIRKHLDEVTSISPMSVTDEVASKRTKYVHDQFSRDVYSSRVCYEEWILANAHFVEEAKILFPASGETTTTVMYLDVEYGFCQIKRIPVNSITAIAPKGTETELGYRFFSPTGRFVMDLPKNPLHTTTGDVPEIVDLTFHGVKQADESAFIAVLRFRIGGAEMSVTYNATDIGQV